MSFDPVTAVATLAEKIVTRIWPDATESEKAKLALEQLRESGELQRIAAETGLLAGQIEVNKVEAGSSSRFVAGWRPFLGWVGGAGVAWEFVLQPVATWALAAAGHPVAGMPSVHSAELISLVLAMLGIASGLRTFEKVKGVAR